MSIPLTDVHVAELIVHGTLAAAGSDSQVCLNIFHFRRTATAIDPVKASIAAAFDTAFMQNLEPLVADTYSWASIGVRYPEDAEDSEVLVAPAGSAVGSVGTDRVPDHVAVSMLLRTSKRGRSYRGAKRFAAIPVADTEGDIIVAGKQAAWTALAASLLAGFTDSDGNVWVPFVLSRTLSQLLVNPTDLVGSDVTQVLLNKNLGSMNSRKVKTVR